VPRTPITNLTARWRPGTGHDDLLLVEGHADLATAVALVERRTVFPPGPDGAPVAARDLPPGDIDALILALRAELLGDRLIAEGTCASCGALVDVDFGIADYLDFNRPRSSPLAEPAEQPGWWRLRRTGTMFRLPTVGDVLAARAAGDARSALTAACVQGQVPGRALRAVERAMSRLAPVLRTIVRGQCPECAAPVDLDVDAPGLCLAELGFLAGTVLDEVHLLAATYHWTERAILELPSTRRAAYAERARLAARAALAAEMADD
jgi:hypothetical protein